MSFERVAENKDHRMNSMWLMRGRMNRQKLLNGMLKNGFAVQQQKLFWYIGLHPAAAAPGNNNGKIIVVSGQSSVIKRGAIKPPKIRNDYLTRQGRLS